MKKNVFILFVVLVGSLCIYVTTELFSSLPIGNKYVEVEIPRGSTFRDAAEIFSKAHIVMDTHLFIMIGRLTGLDRKIRAGYYSIYSSMSLIDLLQALRKGQIIEYEVTVLEGDSLREIGTKLSDKGIVSEDEYKAIAYDEDFLYAHDIDANSAEGYLYPDTYRIPKGMPPEDALGMMINRMREKLTPELLQRASEIGFSEKQVLTLASIIEKEAVVDSERPVISAVYHNRLRKKMRLQADPTAIYGVKSFQEKITLSDLKRKTPYNTYFIHGLPPGPIASPGIKSINAALYPADVSYLYFVSNNDGTHHFSVTIEEHQAAVNAYREKKAKEDRLHSNPDSAYKANETT